MQRRHNQVVPKARSQKTQMMETIVMARCCTTLFMKTHAAQHMQRAQEFGLLMKIPRLCALELFKKNKKANIKTYLCGRLSSTKKNIQQTKNIGLSSKRMQPLTKHC